MLLPAELIDHIFSFLQEYVLKTCSEAHPLLSRLAERHLYENIIVENQATEFCNNILENQRFMNYPRTLKFYCNSPCGQDPLAMSIMLAIPRMVNLVSVSFTFMPGYWSEEILSAFRNCLQQSSFQQLNLYFIHKLPFSILDDAKNVKQLLLYACSASEDEPISRTSSPLCLETLALSGPYNPYVCRWAMRWVTRLTSLELQNMSMCLIWTVFPEFLGACSNTLTSLRLNMGCNEALRFTHSVLKRLKKLSISSMITRNQWALPEIMRFIKTVPTTPDVALQFHCCALNSLSLSRLDWSLLDHPQFNLTGKRPRVDLCVTGGSANPETILGALAANEALTDLVKRGLVILSSELL